MRYQKPKTVEQLLDIAPTQTAFDVHQPIYFVALGEDPRFGIKKGDMILAQRRSGLERDGINIISYAGKFALAKYEDVAGADEVHVHGKLITVLTAREQPK